MKPHKFYKRWTEKTQTSRTIGYRVRDDMLELGLLLPPTKYGGLPIIADDTIPEAVESTVESVESPKPELIKMVKSVDLSNQAKEIMRRINQPIRNDGSLLDDINKKDRRRALKEAKALGLTIP